jgi:hypothetical protein
MTLTTEIDSTAQRLVGAILPITGKGQKTLFTVTGTWVSTDEITLDLTDSLTGNLTQIGYGTASGIVPTYLFTFNDKEYALSGTEFLFSAIGDPTIWNDPTAAGNGFIDTANYSPSCETLVAIAPYQGKLLFISRRTVLIFSVDPDPALYVKTQTLSNIGTIASLSVQPLGDMDVIMLADNGFRSVRVRDASNNAMIADIGTPVDALVQSILATLTDVQKAASCGIFEPSANRYWCFIPNSSDTNGVGKIFTFSYFPSSEIAAWGQYDPSYQVTMTSPAASYGNPLVPLTYTTVVGKRYVWTPGSHEVSLTCGLTILTKAASFVATDTTASIVGTAAGATFTGSLSLTTYFTPTKFVTYKGQVYARAGDYIFQYGGTGNNVYDNCGVTAVTPYISSQTPGTRKQFESVDAAFDGTWRIGGSTDYNTQLYKTIYNNSVSTFLLQTIGWESAGSHYSFTMQEDSVGYARFSSILCNEKKANEK